MIHARSPLMSTAVAFLTVLLGTSAVTACSSEPSAGTASVAPTTSAATTSSVPPASTRPPTTAPPTTAPPPTATSTTLAPPPTATLADPVTDPWTQVLADVVGVDHAGEYVGAVAALRHADGSLAQASVGSTDLDAQLAPDPNEPWAIGSITKVFVAVVVLQLAEAGAIDLDAGIEAWFPDLADAAAVTPRQLMQHTSGLAEYINEPAVAADETRVWSPEELIAVAEAVGRVGAPGEAHHYANTNFIVLGEIIEQVTGQTWADEVSRRIIEPLDLGDTGVIGADASFGFSVVDGAFVPVTTPGDPSVGGAAGAMQSTAADLTRFVEALAGGSLLSPGSWAAMQQFVPADDLSAFGVVHEYGLGLERYRNDDIAVVGHLGIATEAGHSAFVGIDLATGNAVAVLLNTSEAGPQAVMAIEALIAVAS